MVRWLEPSEEGSTLLTKLVQDTHRQHGQVYLAAIIGAETSIPDNSTRKALAASYEAFEELLTDSWMVLLGHSLRQSLFRSIIAGLGLLLGRRMDIKVLNSVSAMFEVLGESIKLDEAALRASLETAGIVVDGDE